MTTGAQCLSHTQSAYYQPYYIITGNECFISSLIKHFLLLFQGCRSSDEVAKSIQNYSEKNIRWLSCSQVSDLKMTIIQDLSFQQLSAFSEKQKSGWDATQREEFDALLLLRQTEALEEESGSSTGLPRQTSLKELIRVNSKTLSKTADPNRTPPPKPMLSRVINLSAPNVLMSPARPKIASPEEHLYLQQNSIISYYTNKEVFMQACSLLKAETIALLNHPVFVSFFACLNFGKDLRIHILPLRLTEEGLSRFRHHFLGLFVVQDHLDNYKDTEDIVDLKESFAFFWGEGADEMDWNEEIREAIGLCLTESDKQFLQSQELKKKLNAIVPNHYTPIRDRPLSSLPSMKNLLKWKDKESK